jgi:hypothetical protein
MLRCFVFMLEPCLAHGRPYSAHEFRSQVSVFGFEFEQHAQEQFLANTQLLGPRPQNRGVGGKKGVVQD